MKKISFIFLAIIIALFPYTNYHTNPTRDTVKALEKIPTAETKSNSEKNIDNTENKEKETITEVYKEQNLENQSIETNIKNQSTDPTNNIQSTNIDPITEIKNKNDSLGTAGRLYIPEVNINVGINYAELYYDNNYNVQSIVDKEDSAAYFIFSNKTTIADHQHQGFYKIVDLNNEAKAYIKKTDGTIEVYQLINKFSGKNTTTDLIDSTGNSIQNMNGDLLIYTCYGINNGVMITLWNRLV